MIEKPLATSIEREILPETLDIDGGSWDLIDSDAAGGSDRPKLGTTSR